MEVLGNGMQKFAAGSDDESTNIFLGIADDEKVNEGNCRGTFKDWFSVILYGSMGGWTDIDGIGAYVNLKV